MHAVGRGGREQKCRSIKNSREKKEKKTLGNLFPFTVCVSRLICLCDKEKTDVSHKDVTEEWTHTHKCTHTHIVKPNRTHTGRHHMLQDAWVPVLRGEKEAPELLISD